jgi:hypothetical protein
MKCNSADGPAKNPSLGRQGMDPLFSKRFEQHSGKAI